MAVTIVNTINFGTSTAGITNPPAPSVLSYPVQVSPTPGNWLVVVASWRSYAAGHIPDITVADDAHNWWEPLAPTGAAVSSGMGFTRSAIWVAPCVQLGPTAPNPNSGLLKIQVAPTAAVPALAGTVYEVNGLAPWLTSAAVNNVANAATTITATLGAPASSALVFTVAGSDNLADTITLTAGGWGSVIQSTAGAGAAGINCSSAFQVATVSTTGTWNSTGSVDFSEVQGYVLAGASQPATAGLSTWPAFITECAPGFGQQTPPSQLSWTNISGSALELEFTQGRQYETDQLSTGEGTLLLDNPGQAFLPPGSGSLAGLDAGVPVRMRAIWQGGSWQVQWHGDGTHSGIGLTFTMGSGFGTPGVQYQQYGWISSSSYYSAGVQLVINFYNGSLTLIGTATSGTLATGPVPTLFGASGIAPATTAFINMQIQVQGTPASTITFSGQSGQNTPFSQAITSPAALSGFTTATVLSAWVPSVLGPPNPCPWSVPFAGFFERLPQQWDESLRGFTEAAIVDAWFGANYQPQSILVDEILDDVPYAYWPCADAAGSTQASNLAASGGGSKVSVLPLNATLSKYGAGGAVYSFGNSSSTTMLGAQETLIVSSAFRLTNNAGMWELSKATGGTLFQGYSLSCVDGNLPQPANGLTLEFWFQTVTPFTTGVDNFIAAGLGSGETYYTFLLFINIADGKLYLNTQGSAAAPASVALSSVNYLTGTPPLTHVALSFNQTTYTAYINGVQAASGSWSGSVVPLNQLFFDGTAPNSFSQGFWNGFLGHIAIFPRILTSERILTHYNAGIAGMAGEPENYRIERLLNVGNLTGRRFIGAYAPVGTTPVVSCQDIGGQPASSSVNNIATSVLPGSFYVAPTGDMVYDSRGSAWNRPVKWTLGDNFAAGEIPYDADVNFDYDLTKVVNEVQLTQLDDQVTVVPTITALEAASQVQYGTITDITTAYVQTDSSYPLTAAPGLQELANWLAATQVKPHLRLDSLTVNSAGNPALWQFVLTACPGDQVVVNRRPPNQAVMSVTGRISQTVRTFQFTEENITATLQCVIDYSPEENALTADDPVRGLLNGSNILPW